MNDTSRLTTHIFIALIAGILVGLACNVLPPTHFLQAFFIGELVSTTGQVFIRLIKLLVVPVVFVSLVAGMTHLNSLSVFGRIGLKTIGLYMMTTCIAISLAIAFALLIVPGEGFQLQGEALSYTAKAAPSLSQVIINMIPTNPFAALAGGNMLQVIVVSVLFGLGIITLGPSAAKLVDFFSVLNHVVMQVVNLVMKFAPIGVFCLISKTFATQGFEVFTPLLSLVGCVFLVLIIHATVVYSSLLVWLARLNPIPFFIKMRNAILFAFSSASSNATLPLTMQTARTRLGVDNSVAAFSLPLGATINMDGTAIMQGIATVFIASVYQIDLLWTDYFLVVITATLASVGTAGVPGVGMIMLAMVLQQVGLPVEGIALLIGVDRVLDMGRTAVNVVGDAAVTCVVARSENALNIQQYTNGEQTDDAQQQNTRTGQVATR